MSSPVGDQLASRGHPPAVPETFTCDFQQVDPKSSPGQFGSQENPEYRMHLTSDPAAIDNLIAPEEVVIAKQFIRLQVTYPLARPYTMPLYAPNGFSRKALAKIVSNLYKWIYLEEKRSSQSSSSNIPVMYNHTFTAGRFGIWGHGLESLALEEIKYNPQEDFYRACVRA